VAINVTCAKCGRVVYAPTESAGKGVSCPGCGEKILVPADSAATTEKPTARPCPQCGKKLRLTAQLHGKQVRCTQCGKVLVVWANPWALRVACAEHTAQQPGSPTGATSPAAARTPPVLPASTLPPSTPPALPAGMPPLPVAGKSESGRLSIADYLQWRRDSAHKRVLWLLPLGVLGLVLLVSVVLLIFNSGSGSATTGPPSIAAGPHTGSDRAATRSEPHDCPRTGLERQ
jgi:DNA-directed RNA polymerase subunit RPC12/RpoP